MTRPSEHIAAILSEAQPERLIRFDVEAHVRVYVTQGDIEDDRRARELIASGASPEEVVRGLRSIAMTIAQERIDAFGNGHGDSVSASVAPDNSTTDTVNWQVIASPEPEDDYGAGL
jgi:hypothetical protein